MKGHSPARLRHAVEAISADIKARAGSGPRVQDERRLWWELSCCLLSSQVPYHLAIAAADRIDSCGFLWSELGGERTLDQRLEEILRQPFEVEGRLRRYRFPASRSRQLALTHSRVISAFGGLRKLLADSEGPAHVREWLVDSAPGVGPKQASMFLRNVGHSYDLAILDRHVLTYMTALDIETPGTGPTGLPGYVRRETVLRGHAEELGLSVGLMDWAIWIVMRVAKRNTSEPIPV